MGTVMFYHLTRSRADETLRAILPRALGAGWRVYVRGASAQTLAALDLALWQGGPADFLPHGLATGGPDDAAQPILLGSAPLPPNGFDAAALLEGAEASLDDAARLQRLWVLFDGQDPAALDGARSLWRCVTGAGLAAQYWSEEGGAWAKLREAAAK